MKNGLPATRRLINVIGAPIDALTWDTALDRLRQWASARESRVVCICNVHSVITARTDARFADVLQRADMATPDGMPIAWMMRRLGVDNQERINGPDLMWRYCEIAARDAQPIFLLGGTQDCLDKLTARLHSEYPELKTASYAPPFRPLTETEEDDIVRMINESGACTVWVAFGCPKQEFWIHKMRGQVNAVMLGVGAAFDYHAGVIRRAPVWMQRAGFEWLFRLASEPRRLWQRYLVTNSLFLVAAFKQLGTKVLRG